MSQPVYHRHSKRSKFNPTGRGQGSYYGTFTPAKPRHKRRADAVDPDTLTDAQMFREQHFFNEVVCHHLLDAALNASRFKHRWGQKKRDPATIHEEIREGLRGDVCRWLAKRAKREDWPEIGRYSASDLSRAGNDLCKLTYAEFLAQTYGENANAEPRTRTVPPSPAQRP